MLQIEAKLNQYQLGLGEFRSKQGRLCFIRPALECNRDAVEQMLLQLSARTCLLRYLSPLPGLSAEKAAREASRLTRSDLDKQITLLVFNREKGAEQVVAVAELVRNNLENYYELATVVRDDFQGEGVGTIIIRQLIHLAQAHHIQTLQALILSENIVMRRLIRKLPFVTNSRTVNGEMVLNIFLDKPRELVN